MIGDGDAVTREEVRWAYRTFPNVSQSQMRQSQPI
jgi:hypothetical protein